MRVTPWDQYRLVDQEADPDLQLASGKNWLVRGCASLACFGRAAAGLESASPQKVGPTQHQEVLLGPDFEESKDQTCLADQVGDENIDTKTISLRSSLKKPTNNVPISVPSDDSRGDEHGALCEKSNDVASPNCPMERRKVKWRDTSGEELFEIREFEMSEAGSDDESDHGSEKTCACTIL